MSQTCLNTYAILSFRILPILSFPILPRPILPYLILSHPILPIPYYPTLSHPILPYLSYPTLFYSTRSYPIVSYLCVMEIASVSAFVNALPWLDQHHHFLLQISTANVVSATKTSFKIIFSMQRINYTVQVYNTNNTKLQQHIKRANRNGLVNLVRDSWPMGFETTGVYPQLQVKIIYLDNQWLHEYPWN